MSSDVSTRRCMIPRSCSSRPLRSRRTVRAYRHFVGFDITAFCPGLGANMSKRRLPRCDMLHPEALPCFGQGPAPAVIRAAQALSAPTHEIYRLLSGAPSHHIRLAWISSTRALRGGGRTARTVRRITVGEWRPQRRTYVAPITAHSPRSLRCPGLPRLLLLPP